MWSFAGRVALVIGTIFLYARWSIRLHGAAIAFTSEFVQSAVRMPFGHTAGGRTRIRSMLASASGRSEVDTDGRPTRDLQRWWLKLAYDGTDYLGWQRNPGNSIQGLVEAALSKVFREDVNTVGASRTDRGVHARAQVCHFDAPRRWAGTDIELDAPTVLKRLRRCLPSAIFAVSIGQTESMFHARMSALRKRYSYRLTFDEVSPFVSRYGWCSGPLHLDRMSVAVSSLTGRLLDYSPFTTSEQGPPQLHYHGSTMKSVRMALRGTGSGAVVFLECDRFLYKMVRRVVGALVEVGRGRLGPEILAAGVQRAAVPTAPPQGLFLDGVDYPSWSGVAAMEEAAAGLRASGDELELPPPAWPSTT